MLNRKLTGGLAWAGLILIFAVPSADIISAKMAAPATAPDPVTTASIEGGSTVGVPVVKTTPVPLKGKPMPGYISDPQAGPVTGVTVPLAPEAALAGEGPDTASQTDTPTADPPQPMPAYMRPLPPAAGQPQPTQVAAAQPTVPASQPLILDEEQVLANEAALSQQPRTQEEGVPRPPALVTEGDLQDWDSGSLADYLERRGLLSDASYTEEYVGGDDAYDPDGFYLSDGPNKVKGKYRRRPPQTFLVFPFD